MRPRLAACATVHRPPSLATSLPPFAPSPYSCEKKIRKQDVRTERAGAPPPHLRRRRGKVRPPPLPLFSPPHAQDARTESVGAPPPRLRRGCVKVPLPLLPLLQPHTRRQDARTGRAAPPHSLAALVCVQRVHTMAPPFAPAPHLHENASRE